MCSLLLDRPGANGRNIVGQQLPTLLDVTCCVRLHTLLHVVGCCCVLLTKVCHIVEICCVRLHVAMWATSLRSLVSDALSS